MKKLLLTTLCVVALGVNLKAQKFRDLDKSPLDIATYSPVKNGNPSVEIIYSRPQLKGRTMLGDKIPFNKVWRTGANESVRITFYKDYIIGGKKIIAGSYSLFTIPNKNEWTIILNKDLYKWGAYDYDETQDVLRINVPVTLDKESLEALSMVFDANNLYIGWDTTRVAIPLKITE